MVDNIWSEVVIIFEFNSYARCAETNSVISETALTFDVSKYPDWIEPNPSVSGLSTTGSPEASVWINKF